MVTDSCEDLLIFIPAGQEVSGGGFQQPCTVCSTQSTFSFWWGAETAKADPSPGSYPQGVVSLTPSWVQVEDLLYVSRVEGLPLSLYDTTSGESARERIGMQDRSSLLIKASIIILSFFCLLIWLLHFPQKDFQ